MANQKSWNKHIRYVLTQSGKNESATVTTQPHQVKLKGNEWNIWVQIINSTFRFHSIFATKAHVQNSFCYWFRSLSSPSLEEKLTNSLSAADQTHCHSLTLSSHEAFTSNGGCCHALIMFLNVSFTFSSALH